MDEYADTAPISRALVVTAHPDDLDFEAGGTVAGWVRAGVDVAFCLVTDGDAGQSGTTPRDEVVGVRRQETIAAAEALGVSEVRFLGYPDSRVEVTLDLRRDISREIRRHRPERVLTWAPERTWDFTPANHPDHRAVGEATLCAIYPDAANPYIHPELHRDEQWEAWRASEAWLMSPAGPTTYVDITDTFEAKVAALRAHSSQTGHLADLVDRIRGRAEEHARSAGLPAGRLAEVFRVTRTGR